MTRAPLATRSTMLRQNARRAGLLAILATMTHARVRSRFLPRRAPTLESILPYRVDGDGQPDPRDKDVGADFALRQDFHRLALIELCRRRFPHCTLSGKETLDPSEGRAAVCEDYPARQHRQDTHASHHRRIAATGFALMSKCSMESMLRHTHESR